MKKKVLSLLLCALMVFSSMPTMPLADIFTVQAVAADISQLQSVFNSVPAPSTWDRYIDTSALKVAYEYAALVLEKHENFDQSDVDSCLQSLQEAVDNLKLHTQGITLNRSEYSPYIGQTFTLRAILEPADAADTVTWSSSNSSVASVTQTGIVTVNKYTSGKVTITAASNGHSASCVLTILNPLGGVKLSQSEAELYEGKSVTLKATAYGKDAENLPTGNVFYTWSSDDEAVAKVSDNGVVTAEAPGECTITVTATDNTNVYTAKCNVTVSKMIFVTSLQPITITTSGSLTMTAKETTNFRVTVLPSNASVKDLTWKSSDTSVVTVSNASASSSGIASVRLNALKEGTAKITYTTTDGSNISGSFNVDVKPLITSVSLSPSKKVITVDSVGEKFKALITPENAGNQVLSWSSDNPTVCEVDYSGTLIPHTAGTATITAATSDGSNIVVSGTVRVAAKAHSIVISRGSLTLKATEKYTLSATVLTLDGGSYTDVQWTSSDTSVATVNQNGVITAKYPGSSVIKATALDGTEKSAVCVLTVTQPVEGVQLNKTSGTVYVGKSGTLTATLIPAYATNQGVTWSSSDTSVATVDSNGKVTGKKVGTATITVKTAEGGFTASCKVTVSVQTTGVTLDRTTASIKKDSTLQLKATVAPADATNKAVTWTSGNTDVATVSPDGIVRAVAGGTAVITCTTKNGSKTATCTVTVLEDAAGVKLPSATLSLYLGQIYTLKATVLPTTATNKNVTWSSSDTSVVKVSSAGVLTAVKEGTATITVKTADGGFTASCRISVGGKVAVTGLQLEVSSLTLEVGEYYTFLATVLPSNASEKGLVWRTSDKTVISGTQAGYVKAHKAGTAIVTVTTVDGNYQKQCKVTVVQPVTGVRINASSVTLAKGKSKVLTANVFPVDASNQNVTWKSSNTKVVTVSSKGVVTAVGAGSATVTATTVDGGYTSTCNFTVYIPVTGVQLNATKGSVPKGETRQITAKILPSNATNQGITWTSSNNSIATVNETGQVTGISKGTVNITATSKDNGYSATCVVTVVQKATSVKLNFSSVTLDVGKTKTLSATLTPSTVTYKTVTWTSSNAAVAKVSSTGVITAVKAGTATITCTSKDGAAKATCKVTVTQPATGVTLNKTSGSLREGAKGALVATVKPADATNSKVVWSSSNTKIATVDSNGVITGVAPGTVKITVTTVSGGKTATCTVKIIRSVTGISLNKTSLTINVGKKSVITPNVLPTDASIKTVTWTSSNYDVADVTSAGEVVAKAPGYAVITAKTKDKGYTAKCEVLVVQPVTGVKLNKTSGYVNVGSSGTLKATLSPSNATNQKLIWSSSDTSVATVSSSGRVTGKKVGTAIITCKTVDGGYTAKCTVRVVKRVTGLSFNTDKATLYLGSTLKIKATVTPSDATVKTGTWTSSDTSIATVNKGLVTPKKPGTVTITAKMDDGGFTAKCVVTVKRAPTSISLNKTSGYINVGKSGYLKATVLPSNATDKTVTWTSSNTDLLKVNQSGLITGVSRGTATITATTENGLKATCVVDVRQLATGVDLSMSEATVYAGERFTLTASVLPSNANNQNVTWQSENTAIAKVSAKGVVTGVKAGTTTVTAITEDGSFKASCEVTVLQHVTSIAFEQSALSMRKGDEADLTVNVLPANATDKTYTFESSDPDTVFVTATGHIIAKMGGEATITVKSNENNKTAVCRITVIEPVTAVALDKEENTIFVGENFTLSVIVSPTDANNKTVMWTSSDPSVATVSSTGVVTAMKSGEAVITAKTNDGGYTDTCKVTCLQLPLDIELSQSSVTVNTGDIYELTWDVLPEDSFDKEVTWSSDKENIATVENGVIKGINPGTAIITVATVEGEATAVCEVTVHEPVQKVELNKTELTINKNFTEELTATIYPSNASNQNIIWQTSDETVATVSEGLVSALSKGTAYISAIAEDGKAAAVCKVTVRQLPERITFGEAENVATNETIQLTWTVLPENSDDKAVTFESDNKEIATVDGEGVVTGVKAGTAVITATATDGGVQGSVTVTVIQKAEGITVTGEKTTLWVGENASFSAEVLPEDTTDKSVTWSTSDEKVATVDETGKITAIGAGKCDVIATSVCGTAEGKIAVEVLQQITGIELDRTEKPMNIGDTFNLTATVLPEDAYDHSVTFESSDDEVASVDENGVVTAHKLGTATITAISADEEITAECKVRVIKLVESITFTETSIIIEKGKTATLTPVILPEDATEKELTWTSTDEEVVTVDEKGIVTAVGGGVATVRATTTTDGVFAECEVTVDVKSTAIALDKTAATIYCDETLELEVEFTPADTTNKNIIWKTSDEKIATVEKGVVTAHEKGEVTITAETEDTGVTAECVVTVYKHVTAVDIPAQEITLEKGVSVYLVSEVIPEDATNKNLIWESENEDIVTVEDGTVKAVGVGTAKVIAKSEDGGFSDECTVTVIQKPEEIILSEAEITLKEGDEATLTASFAPEDTTEKDIEWSTTDEDIATVENGVVTAVSKGEAEIIATSKANSAVVAKCKIIVTRSVKSISIANARQTAYVGRELTLEVIFNPVDATNQNLLWQVSDKSVATVENGVVMPKNEGTAIVTAHSEDGGYVAYCFITVKRGIDSVSFDTTELMLEKKEQAEIKAEILPANASNKNLIWSSSDKDIASVENGVITAGEKSGTVTIKAVAPDNENAYAECTVTVKEPVTNVELSEIELSMRKGDTEALTAIVVPSNATNKAVTWHSTDETVAKVSEDGEITALKEGTTNIICTTVDGKKTAVCAVKVLTEIEALSISLPAVSMRNGTDLPLTITAQPENHDEAFSFASSNQDVVTVNKNGVVTAEGPGKATVIAISSVSGTRATCEITVIQSVESISFGENESIEAYTGLSHKLSYTVSPENASDKSVRWLSSNKDIATVDEDGLITYHSAGEVVITVQSIESEVYAQCTVNVKQAPENIDLTISSIGLKKGQSFSLPITVYPENSFNKTVTWSSDKPSIADVDTEGKVTAVSKGTAVITVRTWNGIEALCMVEVTE